MSNDDMARIEREAAGIGKFLTFRSLISPGRYLAGLGGVVVVLVLAMLSLAGLNNPTGGGSLAGAFILPFVALWIHISLVVGRLRDAGYHAILGLLLAVAPFAWIALTLEYIEYIGIIMAVVFLALIVAPALIRKKKETAGV